MSKVSKNQRPTARGTQNNGQTAPLKDAVVVLGASGRPKYLPTVIEGVRQFIGQERSNAVQHLLAGEKIVPLSEANVAFAA
jgi:hypothetical protein